MIYRVTLKGSGRAMYFDFLTALEALTFMDAAVQNYVGSVKRDCFEAYLSMKEDAPTADQEP